MTARGPDLRLLRSEDPAPSEPADDLLMLAAAGDDHAAFATLVRRHEAARATTDRDLEQAASPSVRLVRAAVGGLAPDLRVAVVLRYFAGLDYDEIAQVIDRTPSAARSRVFHGLRRLAAVLREEP